MNISAQTVVEKMEEEIMQLAEQVERNEDDAAREHARVLKAYCDILLASGSTGEKTVKRRMEASSVPQRVQQSSPSQPKDTSFTQERDVPSTGGNLLEF